MLAQVDVVIRPQNLTLYSRVLQDHIICEDSRSKVVVEDAYLEPQNSQTLHLRLVKGNATCGISNDHQQGGPYPNVLAPPEHIIPCVEHLKMSADVFRLLSSNAHNTTRLEGRSCLLRESHNSLQVSKADED